MPPCRQAVEDYRAKAGIDAPIVEIDWTGVFWKKPLSEERRPSLETAETVVAGRLSEAPAPAAKASAPSRSASTNANGKARRKPALSVVVVVYNIPREAPRTLLTLSASYQRHIDADDYEVIVVDNGSKPPFDPALIESLSGNFRLIRIDPAPPLRRTPSTAVSPPPKAR